MARTQIAVLAVGRTALVAIPASGSMPAADAANGNFCVNDGFTVLKMVNTDASTHPLNVTVVSGVDGLTAGPRTVTLPVSALVQELGPFPVQFYGNTLLFDTNSALVKIQPVTYLGP